MQPTPKVRDVFALVTNRIIDQLEKGTVPWKQPWTSRGLPRNLISARPYRGINVWLLNMLNYDQNIFLTYNQLRDIGGNVKTGEHGHLVVFWKWVDQSSSDESDNDTHRKKTPMLRYYLVFNVAQCCNIPDRLMPITMPQRKNDLIVLCEEIVAGMPNKPDIRHMGDEAFYQPLFDFISMPSISWFKNSESYYAILFHELIHSTGHQSRLNRKEMQTALPNDFSKYSVEELTAEIGACYLSSYAGIDQLDFDNHVAYIDHWLAKLRKDQRCIVFASAQAQKAVDYILDLSENNAQETITEDVFLKTANV